MRKVTNENDIWNSGQYLDVFYSNSLIIQYKNLKFCLNDKQNNWKKEINATFYRIKHNEK